MDLSESAGRDDLTGTEAKRLIASAAAMGRPIFVFSGGEPLLRSDWEELAVHARSLGLPTALATNGTLIDADRAGRISRCGFGRVSVSLDGADATTHDDFRGQTGCFRSALAGVEALRGAGAAVQINSTIASHNVGQLDSLYGLAAELGAEALHLFLLVPVGCGAALPAERRLDAQQREQTLEWICDRRRAGPLELKATCAPHYYRLAAQRGLETSRSRGCLAGLSIVFVSHSGLVFPCGYLPVTCGNVRRRPLEQIWADSQVLADLRDFDRLEGKCGRCEYRGMCGGCRAQAFAATGNYLAADPACSYEPRNKIADKQ